MSRAEERDDLELLEAHVAGDPDAFNELVRRNRDRLWAVAIRTLGDPEEAADAVQEALISAFRRAHTFRGDAQVTTWLHRIVINACLDRVRRRRTRPTDPLPADEDRAAVLSERTGDDPAEARERRADVMQALSAITPDQRAALVLVDMEGFSVEEAAAILDCPVGTIKSRCSRGRARLAPLLAQYRSRDVPGSEVPGTGRNRPPSRRVPGPAPDSGVAAPPHPPPAAGTPPAHIPPIQPAGGKS
jgi:RNA polymerase sigma factor (sigma-70 family)